MAESEKRTEYLTAKQLAALLQVSESTVHRLRRAGRIPAVQLSDRIVRYNLKEVRHALARSSSYEPPAARDDTHDDAQLPLFFEMTEAS